MRRLSLATTISLGLLAACGRSPARSPLAPHVVRPLTPGTSAVIVVTDGWSDRPVGGATVSNDSLGEIVTSSDGTFVLDRVQTGCTELTIAATGYLTRRACAAATMTLWPVANDAELVATREFAFNRDKLPILQAQPFAFAIAVDQSPDIYAAWSRAIADIANLTDGKLRISIDQRGPVDEANWISATELPPVCTTASYVWSYEVGGFCVSLTPSYYYDFVVDPQRLSDVATATRVLLYAHGFRPHSMPGLMNRTSPASTLSEFERKTLLMVALRWPWAVNWPDTDVQ
jgi:hypothetical protein